MLREAPEEHFSDWSTHQLSNLKNLTCLWSICKNLLIVWLYSNLIWYIWQTFKIKAKWALSDFPLELRFLWDFHEVLAWQITAYLGGKSNSFYCRCLFPPPAASFLQNQSQIILVPPCLYLAITAPNIDANIIIFVKSTSHACMVT